MDPQILQHFNEFRSQFEIKDKPVLNITFLTLELKNILNYGQLTTRLDEFKHLKGYNASGKTNTLRALYHVLFGPKNQTGVMIKKGQTEGYIKLDLLVNEQQMKIERQLRLNKMDQVKTTVPSFILDELKRWMVTLHSSETLNRTYFKTLLQELADIAYFVPLFKHVSKLEREKQVELRTKKEILQRAQVRQPDMNEEELNQTEQQIKVQLDNLNHNLTVVGNMMRYANLPQNTSVTKEAFLQYYESKDPKLYDTDSHLFLLNTFDKKPAIVTDRQNCQQQYQRLCEEKAQLESFLKTVQDKIHECAVLKKVESFEPAMMAQLKEEVQQLEQETQQLKKLYKNRDTIMNDFLGQTLTEMVQLAQQVLQHWNIDVIVTVSGTDIYIGQDKRLLANCSKSEQVLFSLAFKVAAMQYGQRLRKCHFFVCDEILDCLDSDRSELIVKILDTLKGTFKYGMFVTHHWTNTFAKWFK